MSTKEPLFLGFDSGTQSIKAVLISVSGEIEARVAVSYGADLPKYGAPNGYVCTGQGEYRADPRMWAEALRLCMDKLADTGLDLSRVAAVSGDGQQHGSVYLDADGNFAAEMSPIWMDTSTAEECGELNAEFGDALRNKTGSSAVERFTGPQIRRFRKTNPAAYRKTARIHLVSSFLCSQLIGGDAPADYCDASGMNLFDLHKFAWDEEIAEFTAPGLMSRLPRTVPPDSIAGGLSPEYEKWGFRPGIPVAVWTGDNPASLIGTGAAVPGSAVVSLGTSDTFFAVTQDCKTDPDGCGHVFCGPCGGYMSLSCFTNGSISRELAMTDMGLTFKDFDGQAPADMGFSHGRHLLPLYVPEITPIIRNTGLKSDFDISSCPRAELSRILMESRAATMFIHTRWQRTRQPEVIRVTGGASRSPGMRKVLADTFQCRTESADTPDSAALGSAMRAAAAVGAAPMGDLVQAFCRASGASPPDHGSARAAAVCIREYETFEKSFLP